MNPNIFPCLWFNGDGVEAAYFYTAIFGGTITVDTPFVLNIELLGQKLMLLNGGPQFQKNSSISLNVLFNNREEYLKIENELKKDGTILKESIENESALNIWVCDKFGLTWQLTLLKEDLPNQRIRPSFMFFNQNYGKARHAIDFYTSIFPNSGIDDVLNFEEESSENEIAARTKQACFRIDNYTLECSDSSENYPFTFSEAISMVVLTDNQEETDSYWNGLCSGGGQESRCGWLKDPYGISWQIVPKVLIELMNDVKNPEKAQRVMMALSSMTKIVIKDLENAYHAES